MPKNWESECYKKWINELNNSLSTQYRGTIKNAQNSALCNTESLNHLKGEIMRSDLASRHIDELFNNYKASDKSVAAKKNLETQLKNIVNKERIACGVDEPHSDVPVTLAFSNICEKINSIKLDDVSSAKAKKPASKKKVVKDKVKKPTPAKKPVATPQKKKLTVNKTQSTLLQKLHEEVGTGEIFIRKTRNGDIILEKNNSEITRSVKETPQAKLK